MYGNKILLYSTTARAELLLLYARKLHSARVESEERDGEKKTYILCHDTRKTIET
jgi:hypothetical protein